MFPAGLDGAFFRSYTPGSLYGSDSRATLPSSYTFTAADKGVHTFTGLVLQKTGKQTITITGVSFFGLSVIEQVSQPKKR